MKSDPCPLDELKPECTEFFHDVLSTLGAAGLPILLGGAYALHFYTGIVRHTKDLDLFVRPRDFHRVLGVLGARGYRTEITDPVWLGKAFHGSFYVDIIFDSGKEVARVDDAWFEHARAGEALGLPIAFVPVEEMIWSKAFVMERERYDGADIAHLFRATAMYLDWQRLLDRFGPNWPVFYTYLILFGYIYPGERERIPAWLMSELATRLATGTSEEGMGSVCRGTLLSAQFAVDVEEWGYVDPRGGPSDRGERPSRPILEA